MRLRGWWSSLWDVSSSVAGHAAYRGAPQILYFALASLTNFTIQPDWAAFAKWIALFEVSRVVIELGASKALVLTISSGQSTSAISRVWLGRTSVAVAASIFAYGFLAYGNSPFDSTSGIAMALSLLAIPSLITWADLEQSRGGSWRVVIVVFVILAIRAIGILAAHNFGATYTIAWLVGSSMECLCSLLIAVFLWLHLNKSSANPNLGREPTVWRGALATLLLGMVSVIYVRMDVPLASLAGLPEIDAQQYSRSIRLVDPALLWLGLLAQGCFVILVKSRTAIGLPVGLKVIATLSGVVTSLLVWLLTRDFGNSTAFLFGSLCLLRHVQIVLSAKLQAAGAFHIPTILGTIALVQCGLLIMVLAVPLGSDGIILSYMIAEAVNILALAYCQRYARLVRS
jgi:hypothetical protein